MNQKITRIRRKLMAELDKERYEHTLGVMYTMNSAGRSLIWDRR